MFQFSFAYLMHGLRAGSRIRPRSRQLHRGLEHGVAQAGYGLARVKHPLDPGNVDGLGPSVRPLDARGARIVVSGRLTACHRSELQLLHTLDLVVDVGVRSEQVLSHGGCVAVVRNSLATYVALAPRDLETPSPRCKLHGAELRPVS